MSGLRIDVGDLLADAGSRRHVRVSAQLDDLAGSAVAVAGPVDVAVRLERISDGIVVRGEVTCRWRGDCSYCLRELDEGLTVPVDELYESAPVEGETYPILGQEIDLEQMVRDAVLLELPLAPHCAEPCRPDAPGAGSDADGAPTAVPDPRWAQLSELEIK